MRRLLILPFLLIFVLMSSCKTVEVGALTTKPIEQYLNKGKSQLSKLANINLTKDDEEKRIEVKSLGNLLAESRSKRRLQGNLSESVEYILGIDPAINAAYDQLLAKELSANISRSQKDIVVSGTVYGGIEDITDNNKGVAFVVNANRLLYDSGKVDAQVAADVYHAESARHALKAAIEERAKNLVILWVELDRYRLLNDLVDSRLEVLGPLIGQLEKVASAGVGDVAQVSAAQRTVSMVKVKKEELSKSLDIANLNFTNSFGELPSKIDFDYELISNVTPLEISEAMVKEAPLLLAAYASYKASEADIAVIQTNDKVSLGLQARAARPFAGSTYDSDESIGLVLNKTLYQGDLLRTQTTQAEATMRSNVSKLQAAYSDGERAVRSAIQSIISAKKTILIARENAQAASSEVAYLRKQLIIGGSTLESVLSAEALRYEAESREINYRAEMVKAQLSVLSGLGLLTDSLKLNVSKFF